MPKIATENSVDSMQNASVAQLFWRVDVAPKEECAVLVV
jgi:hypothetical protein